MGGGPGSFIGPVHRIAAELDGDIELVAGAFSRDEGRSIEAARYFGLDLSRAYTCVKSMVRQEADREDGVDFITIATPNIHHLEASTVALRAGLPVMSDKPMTANMTQANELDEVVRETGGIFALSFTYSGYPMVREAKELIAKGDLGQIRKVIVEYRQGWLAKDVQSKQAGWRQDPLQAGPGGCVADIGVHAFHLAEFITGLEITSICPDLAAVVPGRKLDDDCNVLLRMSNGARGVLMASQIETGEMNRLAIRVYGEEGGIRWNQESPNELEFLKEAGTIELLRAGAFGDKSASGGYLRLPGGHPEGYLEAFANLYRDFAGLLRGQDAPFLPGVRDGMRGMAFIEAAVLGSRRNHSWNEIINAGGS